MPIKVVCPGCKKALNAPDSMAGKKVRCPGCQQVIEVPPPLKAYKGDTKAAAKPAGAPAAPKPTAPAPKAAAPAAPEEPELSAGPPGKANICPKCKKTLPPDFLICIDCGINVRTGAKFNTSIG